MNAKVTQRAAFLAWNARQRRAHSEYELTKADHALPYGCDICLVGVGDAHAPGWRSVLGLYFCPACKRFVRARYLIAKRRADIDAARAEESA